MADQDTTQAEMQDQEEGDGCCLCCMRWLGCECCCCQGATSAIKLDISQNRSCTDVPCLLVFMMVLIAEFALFMTAVQNPDTNPEFLLFYTDWQGELCVPNRFIRNGTNLTAAQIKSGPAAWPDIRIYDIRICLASCNETQTDARIVTPDLSLDWRDLRPVNGTFRFGGYKSRELLGAYCIPDTRSFGVDVANQGRVTGFLNRFDNVGDAWSRSTSDVRIVWPLFLICVLSGIFVSFMYGLLVRKVGWILIWLSIALTVSIIIFVGFVLIQASQTARTFGYTTTADAMYYSGILITIIGIMLIFAVCFMWDRIQLAITISEETSYAFESMPLLFAWPLVPFFSTVGFISYWLVALVFMTSVTQRVTRDFPAGANQSYYDPPALAQLSSSVQASLTGSGSLPAAGTFQQQTLLNSIDYGTIPTQYSYLTISPDWKYAVGFHWFVFLWVLVFITYHSYMVIAGAYAEWYFSEWENEDDHTKKRGDEKGSLTHCPVRSSCFRTTRYHMGSLAFASGIIAIITFLEHSLAYIEKQTSGENPNYLQKAIFACVACCLRCLKCIFDRINKNGMIVIAVHGSPFCSASFQALSLIFRNIIRASALTAVSGYFEWIGKVAIVCMNLFICLFVLRFVYADQVSSNTVPIALCGIISFVIAMQYMYIFEVGIETVFLCFLIDEEANGKDKQMRAHKNLLDIINATRESPAARRIASTGASLHADMVDDDGDPLLAPTGGETEVELAEPR